MASTTTAATLRPAAVEYPCSDGKIIAEVPRHVDAIFYAMATLRNWFARHDRMQVGANMFLYYQEGDNTKRVTPDLFVVKGLKALPEQSFKLWEAGRPPTWILEVASPSTEDRDRGEKQALYASIGVKEYWRFHPTGSLKGAQRPKTRLEGGVLGGQGYELLESHRDGSMRSEVLGLDVRGDDRAGKHHLLRFRDPETGRDLLTFEELEDDRRLAEKDRRLAEEKLLEESAARREAEQAHRTEFRARRDAEVEIARLKAYFARLEGGREGGPGSDS